ncbi:MAG TPA: hypothetical protein VMH33_07665 [Solirubrobacterales bacterium]|nr:hypothetical protein [Solirubrobacterales bacterium]
MSDQYEISTVTETTGATTAARRRARVLRAPVEEAPPELFVAPQQSRRAARRLLEGWVIALIGMIAYTVIGEIVISNGHVIVFDAVDRLSRAYMVWWNEPAKLAAIGLSLTPMPTLLALPFALIKPLATSLAALPVISAIPAGGTLAVLNATFRRCEMSSALRYAAVLLFAVNPLFVYYAGNGTGVALGVFFISAALYGLISWRVELSTRYLVVAGLALAFGAITYYPLIAWGLVLGLAIIGLRASDKVPTPKIESAALVYLTPFAYSIMVWILLNAIILGSPFGWLGEPSTYSAINASAAVSHVGVTFSTAIKDLLELTVGAAPIALVAVPALILVAFSGVQGSMSGWLAVLILLIGALIVGNALIYDRADLLSLETGLYLAVAGTAGLAWVHFAGTEWRAISALGILAMLALALPLSWNAMKNYPHQNQEQAFTRFISSGNSQEGTFSKGGYEVGIDPELQMAEEINRIVGERKDSILTDNAQTYAVILLTGRPGVFVDRIDHGDEQWRADRDNLPKGIEYVLIATQAKADEIVQRYPDLPNNEDPHFQAVVVNKRYMLAKVVARGDGKTAVEQGTRNLITPPTPVEPEEETGSTEGIEPTITPETTTGGAGAGGEGQTSAPTIEGQ